MPRPHLTAEQADTIRNDLMDVALDLYEEHGFEGMSFRAIASVYGCSPTKPHLHFGSKSKLVDALRIRSYEWMRDELTKAAELAEEPVESLQFLAEAYVRVGIERPRMYELMYSQDGIGSETDPSLLEAKQNAIGVCRQVIVKASESRAIELLEEPDTVAHIFWIAAHGLVSLERGGLLVVGKTIEQLLPTLFDGIVRGFTENLETSSQIQEMHHEGNQTDEPGR